MTGSAFTNFVTGQCLEAIILGTLCFLGMLIFGFPYAAVVSVLIAITALVPIFGAFIGGGVSALLILMVDPLKALLFIVYLLILYISLKVFAKYGDRDSPKESLAKYIFLGSPVSQ